MLSFFMDLYPTQQEKLSETFISGLSDLKMSLVDVLVELPQRCGFAGSSSGILAER
jgi:hypothetical protein